MPAAQEFHCPNCRRSTVIDPARPLERQRCHRCGRSLQTDRMLELERVVQEVPVYDQDQPRGARRDDWVVKLALGLGLALLLALGWYGYRLLRPVDTTGSSKTVVETSPALPYYDARTLAEQVLAAASPDALLPLLTNPDAARPQLQQASRLPLGGKVLSVSPTVEFEGHALQRVNVLTERGQNLRMFVEKVDGKFLADWPSLVGQSELTLAQLLHDRPSGPKLLRVLASAMEHPLPPFDDAQQWFCVHLTAPDSEEICYGYLSLKNPAFVALTKRIPLFSAETEPELQAENEGVAIPLAVRVVFPKDAAEKDQVEIREVVGSGWFIP